MRDGRRSAARRSPPAARGADGQDQPDRPRFRAGQSDPRVDPGRQRPAVTNERQIVIAAEVTSTRPTSGTSSRWSTPRGPSSSGGRRPTCSPRSWPPARARSASRPPACSPAPRRSGCGPTWPGRPRPPARRGFRCTTCGTGGYRYGRTPGCPPRGGPRRRPRPGVGHVGHLRPRVGRRPRSGPGGVGCDRTMWCPYRAHPPGQMCPFAGRFDACTAHFGVSEPGGVMAHRGPDPAPGAASAPTVECASRAGGDPGCTARGPPVAHGPPASWVSETPGRPRWLESTRGRSDTRAGGGRGALDPGPGVHVTGFTDHVFLEARDRRCAVGGEPGGGEGGVRVESPVFTLRYPTDFFGLWGAEDRRERMLRGTSQRTVVRRRGRVRRDLALPG